MLLVVHSLLLVAVVAGLAATRKLLVFELSGISALITGSPRPGLVFYTLLTFPGTVLHELSHWLMAELLRVPTGRITILPESEVKGGEQRLGSVLTARTDPLRGFLIGLAPFVTGLLALFLLTRLFQDLWGVSPWWHIALVVYGVMVVGNSMLISREDRRYWPLIAILIVLSLVVISQLNLTLTRENTQSLLDLLSRINLLLGLAILLNLALLGAVFALRYSLQKLTGKRVTVKRDKQ